MRVISGKYKGRTVDAPKGGTRPTLDRTKETLFNILNFFLPDAKVLDLFAGSGQLGIESLSRGAAEAVFCDKSEAAVKTVRSNCAKLGLAPRIFCCDYKDCLTALKGEYFDAVFIDPPYNSRCYKDVLEGIVAGKILSEKGVAVCEMSAKDDIPQCGGLVMYDSRKIGSVKFCFYKREDL